LSSPRFTIGSSLKKTYFPAMKMNEVQNITTNRKSFHDYFILEKIEAGIELRD